MRSYVWLEGDTPFPPAGTADRSGILCLGGDLSPERLIDAYSRGIFPWYDEEQPIIWHSPDPRFVLFPEKIKVSRSMRQVLSRREFAVTGDTAFEEVIRSCSKTPRRRQDGTWITTDMIEAYIRLHREGYAHSVEAWKDGILAGGLYGVSLGNVFFGESMFANVSNASKAAFITLTEILIKQGITLIDSQVHTDHLASLGAESISRNRYLSLLKEGMLAPTRKGSWSSFF
jgi:leucyl/phenylalanyl-tRNA--protein transferase